MKVTLADIDLGFHKKSPVRRIIRQHCIECCGGHISGADGPAGCTSKHCRLYPYRMGNNPFLNPLSEHERQRRSQALADMRSRKTS